MDRLVVLSVVAVTVLAVDKRECEKMFAPHVTACCKKTSDLLDKHRQTKEFQECFQVNLDPALCEYDLCIAKKQGLVIGDNALDKNKLKDIMTKDFDKDLMKDVQTKCFDGDLTDYGPPDYCEFFKMRLCITAQMLKNCPDWNDNYVCKALQGLVQDCGKTVF